MVMVMQEKRGGREAGPLRRGHGGCWRGCGGCGGRVRVRVRVGVGVSFQDGS